MHVGVTLFAMVAVIGFLMRSNRQKSRKIKDLNDLLLEKIAECEQLEQMILKYGTQEKKRS